MARLVSIVFASVLFAASAQAQVAPSNAQSPWHYSEDKKVEQSFDVPDSLDDSTAAEKGSVIVAGTELIPNAMLGIGMFGPKTDRPNHRPSTNSDYAIPRTRKAAVGFSLRF